MLSGKYLLEIYISEVAEKQYLSVNQHWKTVELRAILFVKDEASSSWSVHYTSVEMNLCEAEKLSDFAQKLPYGGKLLIESSKIKTKTKIEERAKLLKENGIQEGGGLLGLFSKILETELKLQSRQAGMQREQWKTQSICEDTSSSTADTEESEEQDNGKETLSSQTKEPGAREERDSKKQKTIDERNSSEETKGYSVKSKQQDAKKPESNPQI
mmetsp:Transcript_42729/g.49105  ORF Transcript_42729/g.49105 Transcript_42729/m.49105 type:complete len:214 (-) Transcript_42729:163-804(-)